MSSIKTVIIYTFYESCVGSVTKKFACGLTNAILMVRSLNSHQMATFLPYFNTLNEHRFHLEYLQILSRHTNDIKHSFIFKKPFFNVFHTYNGITGYISPFHYRLMSLSNSTTFCLHFYLNLLDSLNVFFG